MPQFGPVRSSDVIPPGGGDLIRAILQLGQAAERLRESRQEIDVSISLGDRLKAAATPGAKVRVLGDIAESGAAGSATRQVRKSIQEFQKNKYAIESLRASRDRLRDQIDRMRRQHAAIRPGSAGAAIRRIDLRQRIREAETERLNVRRQLARHRYRARRAVERGEEAAQGGIQGSVRGRSIERVLEKFRVSVDVAATTFRAAQQVTGQAYVNLHRYGGYSPGGARAQITEEMGNLMRNIRISHATSASMQQFADASQRFKNALEPTMIGMINVVNKLAARLLNAGAAGINGANGQINPAFGAGAGALGMGAAGARMGMMFGPWGAAIGGLGGAALGGVGGWKFGAEVNKDIDEQRKRQQQQQNDLAADNRRQLRNFMNMRRPPNAVPFAARGGARGFLRGLIPPGARRAPGGGARVRGGQGVRARAGGFGPFNAFGPPVGFNKPNSKDQLEARKRARKQAAERDQRDRLKHIEKRIDEEATAGMISARESRIKELFRDRGILVNKGRHRPGGLTDEEKARVKEYDRQILRLNKEIGELQEKNEREHNRRVPDRVISQSDPMMPHLITAGKDRERYLAPYAPRETTILS